MFKIYLGSDNLIEFNGPTNVVSQAAITGATVTASLYDDRADTCVLKERFQLSADEAAAQTTLSIFGVPKVTVAVGDTVRIALDDGTHDETTIAAGSTLTELEVLVGLTSAASKGNLISLKTKALGVDTLRLDRAIPYELGEQISVTQDDGTQHVTTVADLDDATHEIVLADVTTAEVSTGNAVSQKIGGDITLTQYGTPAPNDTTWGYRGVLPDVHAGLKIGQRVRIVVDFDGGANLKRVEHFYAQVMYGGA